MNAIVLAGGFGSRLKPLTNDCPKPMLPVANRPMLDFVVSQLSAYGIRDVVFTLGYMPELVKSRALKYKGIRCSFEVEENPLGTAGGVKAAERYLDDLFFVVSGDALSDVNLGLMARRHLDSGAEVTIATTSVSDPTRYGVVVEDEDGFVTSFVEKPSSDIFGTVVSTGIYIINKRVLQQIPRDVPFDFAKNLFPALVEGRKICTYFHDGYWCDIGDKAEYFNANFYMKSGAFYDFVEVESDDCGSTAADTNLIAKSAVTVGTAKNSIIGAHARIASNAVIDECIILPDTTVTGRHFHSIVGVGFEEKIEKLDKNRHLKNKISDKKFVHTV